MMLCRDCIYLWLVYYSYNKVFARVTVQFYHMSLAEFDKIRLYKEFYWPNLKICIIVFSDMLAYGVDILDINWVVLHGILLDLFVNMLW